MKKALILIPLLFILFCSCDTLNQVAQTTIQQYGKPTNLEINNGLKQALELGTNKSSDQLSSINGFFGNAAVKILFPPEAQKVEKTLRSIGLSKLADNVILSLNRAAEDAAGKAKPIFVNAIKQMTLTDVTNILLGNQDAATQYFKRTTTAQLAASFKPVIQNSLNKVGATKYYTDAANAYNKVPFVSKVNPDITDYVTQKAIDGLFVEIAQEELNIRQNLGARTTPLLQKVFSYYDKNKR
ncbi:DUF4197 domain-containing protein [Mucilaginibacter phyllosphaerae]|uniref:DUF4197 domain-containing protein n=1 Tax=Mucilaginibacter phyllosphaerae TaxID=1812349 RepID=A0A4Y8AA54_9SPHI|nr:DUF4197 domain-containing protein [Mucilaginibacter phyllosphaerae]MBB3969975.1 hypothetical protein [Mucilaginibacter phyllosphaerae]TEW65344.1 DUF4197 domain-containing protein [Mucilaginibacter phyllosphaerae]GGH16470.1 hypothetical protein GCM10007352_25890 [Mucilaginibacter phyllosphaerae]